ncbi:hypothetical protein SAMN05421819_4282 [Bryocella elongata]|uniref:Uncharacterized protein n=1 Tax=Bryocella elongata TaxID=863522 RepID=A0A1H6C7E1_9BACT|nr:hypothetical protein [Bryocella elongata]SEG68823.1 hypothetical protein SAMN05421819_4282 [Bryocella elongata]
MNGTEQASSKTPIRGTQSFVGVMSEVWKRPSLTAIEVLTRWIAWAPVLLLTGAFLGTLGMDVHFNPAGAQASWTQLQTSAILLEHGAYQLSFHAGQFALNALPILAFAALWGVISGHGRTLLLHRFDSRLIPRRLTLCLLAMARVVLFTAALALWLAVFLVCWIHFVQVPQSRGEYPGYVPGFAIVILFTLGLFVLWSSTSWILRLAPVLAMAHRLGPVDALRAAWKTGPLRGKLIEINLVMGVVKVGLLVWSLALSSCPLPFANNQTQEFLNWWWLGTVALWIVSSAYFHVVRQAAYVRLADSYDFLPHETARQGNSAS